MSADLSRRAFEKWHKLNRCLDRENAWRVWQEASHQATRRAALAVAVSEATKGWLAHVLKAQENK